MTDHDAEMDALAAEMEAAGLITIITRSDGGIAYRLTPEGERMAQQLTLSGDDSDLEKLLGHE